MYEIIITCDNLKIDINVVPCSTDIMRVCNGVWYMVDKFGKKEEIEQFRLKLIEQIEKQLACKIESIADILRTLPVSIPLTEDQISEAIYGNYLMMVQIAESLSKELPDSYPIFSGYAYDCDGKVIKSEIDGTVSDLKNYLRLNNQLEAKIISKHEFVDIDSLNKEFS